MNHRGGHLLAIRSEGDGCAEDPLKRVHKSPVLQASMLHPEGVEHRGSAVKRDPRSLLTNRHRCEENWDQTILPSGQAITGMTGYLEHKLSIPAFRRRHPAGGRFTGKPHRTKWAGRNSKILLLAFAVLPDHSNGLGQNCVKTRSVETAWVSFWETSEVWIFDVTLIILSLKFGPKSKYNFLLSKTGQEWFSESRTRVGRPR
jgi:hypothetical protein